MFKRLKPTVYFIKQVFGEHSARRSRASRSFKCTQHESSPGSEGTPGQSTRNGLVARRPAPPHLRLLRASHHVVLHYAPLTAVLLFDGCFLSLCIAPTSIACVLDSGRTADHLGRVQ